MTDIREGEKTGQSNGGFKVLLLVGGAFLVFVLLASAIGHSKTSPEQRIANMEKACQTEFGSRGELAVNDCKIRAMADYYKKIEADKQKRATEALN